MSHLATTKVASLPATLQVASQPHMTISPRVAQPSDLGEARRTDIAPGRCVTVFRGQKRPGRG